jgi:hypothetical protein
MSDDYPTEEELARIKAWPFADSRGWFDFIKSIWWMPDWGWREKDGEFSVSTGGWSGNEDIIGAMGENVVLWSLTWQSNRRGGHYEFKLGPQVSA